MKKIILLAFALTFVGYSFAEQQIIGDCELGARNWDYLDHQLDKYYPTAKVLLQEDIQMAHLNLKSYCCNMGYLDSKSAGCQGAKNGNSDFAMSYTFFSQLWDIASKKLRGDQETSPVPVDPLAQQYRQKDREISTDINGARPQQYFDIQQQYFDMTSYDPNTSLSARYDLACQEIYTISQSILKVYSSDERSSLLDSCKQSAGGKIANELKLLKSQAQSQANRMLEENLKNYAQKYFGDRITWMIDKVSKMVSDFRDVNKKSSPGVKTASG